MRWNYHLQAYHRSSSPYISLTFDDGPTAYTEEILALLQGTPHKATFFLIGKRAEERPETVQRILEQGHSIGNHTYSHSPGLGFKGTQMVEEEILRCDEVLRKLTGKTPRFYRPPFGVTNPSIARAVKKTGHMVMGWSIRSLDTKIKHSNRILARITSRLAPGDVVLLHDTNSRTVEVVQALLPELGQRNLRSITLDDLHDEVAYN
jgi:peptidoglycan/xylan/chitin deacetylase (PgdA/CDA1 family)